MFSPVVNNFISEQAAVVASNNIHGMPSSYSYHFRPNVSSSSSSSSSFLATCRRRSQDITGQIKHLIQLPTSSSSSVKFSSGSRRPSLPAILLSIRKEFFMNLECYRSYFKTNRYVNLNIILVKHANLIYFVYLTKNIHMNNKA
ncbi:hypothetical protein DERF_002813 [Dermatophagoides farinae]|uniref:Uncharacterized protein n=1 Tax=Dermatophagoides farinae TaxID=6954 RepID=A0A922IEE5_DERFA|nr:hypothetical protein DERF_002813 [Dermatophagoides farinae]